MNETLLLNILLLLLELYYVSVHCQINALLVVYSVTHHGNDASGKLSLQSPVLLTCLVDWGAVTLVSNGADWMPLCIIVYNIPERANGSYNLFPRSKRITTGATETVWTNCVGIQPTPTCL